QELRLLVEQSALAYHLDRARAARIEHEAEPTFQQAAHPLIADKSFLLATGKSEQSLGLAEPAGNLWMLAQVNIGAGAGGICSDEANSEGTTRDGHQALLLEAESAGFACGSCDPRSSSSELFSNLSSMSSLSRSPACRMAAYWVKAVSSLRIRPPVAASRGAAGRALRSRRAEGPPRPAGPGHDEGGNHGHR